MSKLKNQMKILIVDDSPFMRNLVRKFLLNDGFTLLLEASNGKEAFEIAQSQPVDLIISDLNMPKMDGMELLVKIKNSSQGTFIKFIMITVEAFQKTMNKAFKLKVDSYIVKPFEALHLISEINRLFPNLSD